MANRSMMGVESTPCYRVYVGNLPDGILQTHIEKQVESVRLVRNNETGEFRGFAYVDFKDVESLNKALLMNGTVLNDRKIRVSVAEDKKGKNNRGGGRGDYNRGGGRDSVGNRGGRQSNKNWQGMGNNRGQSPHNSRGGGGGGNNFYPNKNQGSYGGPGRRSNAPGRGMATGRPFHNNGNGIMPQTLPAASLNDPNRPRIKLGERVESQPSNSGQRDTSIFGGGRPREASPVNEQRLRPTWGNNQSNS